MNRNVNKIREFLYRKVNSMNNQFIQGVIFDWNRIDNDSYLKRIEAFKGGKNLILINRSLFLSEKMAAVNQLYWRQLPWHMGLILRAEQKIMFFLRMIHIYSCTKAGAQFIIVTHSPILLGIPDAEIYCFDNGRIHLCEYEDTESYQVTEMFINNRQMLLDRLLRE